MRSDHCRHARWAALATALIVALAGESAHAFDLQGHRGARGLAPENTLAAFERALAVGVTTLELDIGLTADGVPVIVHDVFLPPDMTRDAHGAWLTPPTPLVHALPLADLQAYDVGRAREGSATARQFARQQPADGQRVPTLAALFERVKALGARQVRFNIETKLNPDKPQDTAAPEAFVSAILAVVRQAGMTQRVTLQSFDWRTLKLAQRQAPEIPTACLTTQTRHTDSTAAPAWTAGLRRADYASLPEMVRTAGCRVWSPNFASLDEALVRQARQEGLQVIPWTVNAPADMRQLVGWGVDGLITDEPDRAREVLGAAGVALPPAVPAAAR